MALSVYFAQIPIQNVFGTVATLPALLTLVGTGAIVYLAMSFLTQRDMIEELWGTLVAALPKKFGAGRRLRRSNGAVSS